MTMTHEELTEEEGRAFEFGPRMRRLARAKFGGALHRAFATEKAETIAQHRRDVAAIRPQHRKAYIDLIARAESGEV